MLKRMACTTLQVHIESAGYFLTRSVSFPFQSRPKQLHKGGRLRIPVNQTPEASVSARAGGTLQMIWWKQNTATSLSLSPPHGAVGNSSSRCSEPLPLRFLHLRKRPQPKSTKGFDRYNGTCEGDSNASQCFGTYYHMREGAGGLKYSSSFQEDGSLVQIRSSRFGPIKHFSPSEVKLASASALSSFMVRKIKCQTHLSPESRPLPPSTPPTC